MRLKRFLVLLGALLLGHPVTAGTGDAAFDAEVRELQHLPDVACEKCILLSAMDRVLPIPNRYALVGDVAANDDGCVSLTSPSSDLLPSYRKSWEAAGYKRYSGIIRYCRVEVLDAEIERTVREPPNRTFDQDGLRVTVWAPIARASPLLPLHRIYIRTATEGLLVEDVNPQLGRAILDAASRTRKP